MTMDTMAVAPPVEIDTTKTTRATKPPHPAKFSEPVLQMAALHLKIGWRVLDPFGGVGRLSEIPGIQAFCVEIERDWANQIVGDALRLPFPDATFDAVCTSPVYGNRMSDHHDARDGSKRFTYKHCIGHDLHANNAGQLQWGERYQVFHREAWAEVVRCLAPGGDFILNCSDHIRKHQEQPVTSWHLDVLQSLGLAFVRQWPVHTNRMGNGANRSARVAHETITVLRKGR